MDEIPITVKICDRPYKLKVSREEEAIFREAANMINDRIDSYSRGFAFKDRQDLLAMVALQYASNALKGEKKTAFLEDSLEERLLKLSETLSL